MIRAFLVDGKYVHYKFRDAYIEVLKSEVFEDYWTITVMWKCQRTNRLFMDKEQVISVHKSTYREWDVWQK